MSHRIYTWEPDWTLKADGNSVFREHAKALGLDLARYDDCMETARFAGRIQAGRNEGAAAGVGSTPTFLINGRLLPLDNLQFIQQLKKKEAIIKSNDFLLLVSNEQLQGD